MRRTQRGHRDDERMGCALDFGCLVEAEFGLTFDTAAFLHVVWQVGEDPLLIPGCRVLEDPFWREKSAIRD